ncbi:ATP synthase F1 subunit epsilon [Geothrix sp. 21YS21S-2]|uniref:ATP synthase F1 subunit epsilon n=1 Tax=Geothrix sp. 21YS21S-2 TaxID=3068893 RepID=UPI0027BA6B86|nr:ATP synthase F1 subunit epsilon [Geothrix sp. 21YS21S-2]
MTDSILLEVLTPERRVFSAHVSEVQFPTAELGYYGVLPGHTPLVTALGTGLVYYTENDQKHWLTVFGGFAEVGPDHVTVLARISETVDMIDADRAEAARVRALKMIKDADTEDELDVAQAKLAASLVRLQAAGKPIGH